MRGAVALDICSNSRVGRIWPFPRGSPNPRFFETEGLDKRIVRFSTPPDCFLCISGYDACFYCAGVSSVGLKEPEYTAITYATPLHFAEVLARLNPGMVLVHVSGAQTDGSDGCATVVIWTKPRLGLRGEGG